MYRHELKYLINKYEFEILKNNLSAIMDTDIHSKSDEGYFIRSMYFDDYKDTSYNQVLDGISKREKYRIRYYDYDNNYISLEKKDKVNNRGIKRKDILSKEEVNKLIKGIDFESDKSVLNELLLGIKTSLYKPVVIIDYNRFAFTYPVSDVRITLDYNISCSYNINDFFNKDVLRIPILDKNMAILEVKYNEFLPEFIRNLIDMNLENTSFSKYGNARMMLEKIRGGK